MPEQARIRLSSTIDISKADPECPRCRGRGVLEMRDVSIGAEGVRRVPVICRCVSERGGVAQDTFDRILALVEKRLADGTFGESLARDVSQLPPEHRATAMRQLQEQAAREDLDERVRAQVQAAVRALGPEA